MDSVKVAVRVRPLVPQEIETGCRTCIDVLPELQQIVTRLKQDRFTYNYVFDSSTPQIDVYDSAVKHLVMQLFKGYNVTVLAYGQTGSGKTYSMGTCPSSSDSDVGIIPRAITDIFEVVNNDSDWTFNVNVSFLELYNEQLIDLLSGRNHNVVELRESSQGICIPGLTQRTAYSSNDVIQCLQQGSLVRTTGATAMNAQSSRSHAIFTIYIRQTKKNNGDDAMSAKFHLVDLAGSERSKRTKAEGVRFQEGVHINKELFVLGNVISALGDGAPFVNYRDSKLTRLLQDSLGGNALTLMLACVSPADSNLDETINTLRYADRARKIKNKPIVNQDPNKQEINRLRREVEELQLALLSNKETISCPPEHQDLLEKNSLLLERNKLLCLSLDNALSQTTTLLERVSMAEAARDRIKDILTNLNFKFNNTVDVKETSIDEEKKLALEALQSVLSELNVAQEKSESERLKFEEELCKNSSDANISHGNETVDSREVDDLDAHNLLQQAKINDEIHQLDKNLAWKEALAAKLAVSNVMEASIKQYTDEEILELKHQIDSLHHEKQELEKQLINHRNSNIDHKLAEERRRRVKELEEKISALNKKVLDQDRIIKMKEKNGEKIKNLNNEIMTMKRMKVQLINKMKSEGEKFRQAKSEKEQEMYKLRQQNRQKETKLAKMENFYTKQQNVHKRKLEESARVIKRLKETLALQKQSKEKRSFLGNPEKVNSWVSQEFSAILNTLEAERTLDNLMEDRCLLAKERTKLEDLLKDPNVEEKEKEKIRGKIKCLNEDLELRSTQIVDLKQKLQSLESYQEGKSRNRDRLQTMADANIALKCAFETASTYLSDFYKEKYSKEAALHELQESYNGLLEKLQKKEHLLNKETENLKKIETEYNEKVFVLLRRLQSYESEPQENTSRIPLQTITKPGHQSDEESKTYIQQLETKIQELEKQLGKRDQKKSKGLNKTNQWNAVITPETRKRFYEDDDDEEIDLDDSQNDPDWQKTPVYRKLQTVRGDSKVPVAHKRNIFGQPSCGCRGECATKVCSCRKNGVPCSGNCKCSDETCKNKENERPIVSNDNSSSDDSDVSFKKPRSS